jgi:hypothetical protein
MPTLKDAIRACLAPDANDADCQVTIEKVEADPIKIGGPPQEVTIKGKCLDRPGLQAQVLNYLGDCVDGEFFIVEQPLEDDISDDTFPITVTALIGADEEVRSIIIKLKDDEFCDGKEPDDPLTWDVEEKALKLY